MLQIYDKYFRQQEIFGQIDSKMMIKDGKKKISFYIIAQ